MHLKLAFTATCALSVLGTLAAPAKRQTVDDTASCVDSDTTETCIKPGLECVTGAGVRGIWNENLECVVSDTTACTDGQVRGTNGCVTPGDTCDDGRGVYDNDGNCQVLTTCPEGQVRVSGTEECVVEGSKCDCDSCGPSGGQWDKDGICKPSAECPQGDFPNPDGDGCVTPGDSCGEKGDRIIDKEGKCAGECQEGWTMGPNGCFKEGEKCDDDGALFDSEGNCPSKCPEDKDEAVEDHTCWSENGPCIKDGYVGKALHVDDDLVCAITGEECVTESKEAGIRGEDPAVCVRNAEDGTPCQTAGGNNGAYENGICVASGPCDNGGECTTVDNKSGKILDTCQCRPPGSSTEPPVNPLPGTVCYSRGDAGIIDEHYRCVIYQGPSGETIINIPNQPTIIYPPGKATPPAGKPPTRPAVSGTASRVNGTATRATSTATTRASTAGTTVDYASPIAAIASIAGVLFGTVFLL